MLVNLSDVLTAEGKQSFAECELSMSSFQSRAGEYEIVKCSPISLCFTNLEKGKCKIEGHASLQFRAFCDRCLEEVFVDLDLRFDRMAYAPDVVPDEEDAEDNSYMDGYQLDVDTFVYNEIIENWPAKILCKEDCKGICPVCGQNLNIRDCGCDTFVPDPRMAVIQDIFNGNKEV